QRDAIKLITGPPKANGKAPAPKAIAAPAVRPQPTYTETSNKTQPHLYALQVWVDLPLGEREKLVGKIGLKEWLESIPQSWRDSAKYSEAFARLAKLANEK